MAEVIVFLITFTAAALAIAMIAVAGAFVMFTKRYEPKEKPDKKVVKEES